MTETFFTIELAVLGLVIGSFLNVVIARLPKDESIVRPRSKCPKCNTPIAWYDNVPVISWVLLRAKCRHCQAPISPRYVIVELITGTLFLACVSRFGWTWDLVMALTFVTLLIPLIFIDAEHWILPFELTVPGIALGLLLRIPMGGAAVVTGLIGAGVAYVGFRVMEYLGWFFARREALGAGDKFLLALIGAFLGWRALLGVVALSSLQGAFFGIARIIATGRAAPELPPPPGTTPSPPAGETAAPVVDAPVVDAPVAPSTDTAAAAAAPTSEAGAAPEADPAANAPAAASADGSTPPAADSASPSEGGDEGGEEEDELTFTPDFLRPGVSFGRRLLLVPWTLFLQPIPDEPEAAEGEEEPEWVPGATNLPFGPWIALAALEMMLLGPWVAAHVGDGIWANMVRMLFGT